LQSSEPYRQKFVLERCMRTEYVADTLQSCYFVIHDWEDVIQQLDIAIIPACLQAMHSPTLKPDEAPPSTLLVALH
jgi:phenylalanine-4-hydroxylase